MGFFEYTLLGGIAFAMGWAIRTYVLAKRPAPDTPYSFTHPVIMSYMGAFLVIMLLVSALIGRFILNHQSFDFAYILVNSLVATFVFSFGINPDTVRYDVPD